MTCSYSEEEEEEEEEEGDGNSGSSRLLLACMGLLCNRKSLPFLPHRGPCPHQDTLGEWSSNWTSASTPTFRVRHICAVHRAHSCRWQPYWTCEQGDPEWGFLSPPATRPLPQASPQTFQGFSSLFCIMGMLVISPSGSSENEMKKQVWKSGWRVLMLTE